MKRFQITQSALVIITLIFPSLSAYAAQNIPGNDILWVRQSEAYECCVYQAYVNGMRRLRELAEGKEPGTWCVVLDADEMVISNVEFQEDFSVAGGKNFTAMWNAWCMRAEAEALPGAREFCELAKELGGRVIIVTNRKNPPLRGATEKNLKAQGIPYDACLLREGPYLNDRAKTMRREDVEKGTVKTLPEGMKLPPLDILMLAGDQTHDLYEHGAGFDKVKDRFGKDLMIIPNPMYGDWARGGSYKKKAKRNATKGKKAADDTQQPITWQEAMQKVGQEVIVEGTIVDVYIPERGPAKMNFTKPWWKGLVLVVWKKEMYPNLTADYLDKRVRVRGKVTTYTGTKGRTSYQIEINSAGRITVVP